MNTNNLAPIVIFAFNRPQHTRKTLEALSIATYAESSKFFVFCDGPRNSEEKKLTLEVQDVVRSFIPLLNIELTSQPTNLGLAQSVISGVTKVFSEYNSVIVVEDDIICSTNFLTFMNQGLNFYKTNNDIFSLTGFNFHSDFTGYDPQKNNAEIAIHPRPMSWSWATWKDRWSTIDWDVKDFKTFIKNSSKRAAFSKGGLDLPLMLEDQMAGRVNSWYIRFCFEAYKKSQVTIYPKISLVNNSGHDSSGTHSGNDEQNIYSHTETSSATEFNFPKNPSPDIKFIENFNNGFKPSLKRRAFYYLKRLFS